MKRTLLVTILLLGLLAGTRSSEAAKFGSLSALGGGTVGSDGDGAARFGWLALFSAEFPPFLAIGPELGFFRPREDATVLVLGLSGRLEPDWAHVRPYATAGAGVYFWDDDPRGGANYIGIHLGAGLRVPARARWAVRLDARLHLQVQDLAYEDRLDFMTYLLGIQYSW